MLVLKNLLQFSTPTQQFRLMQESTLAFVVRLAEHAYLRTQPGAYAPEKVQELALLTKELLAIFVILLKDCTSFLDLTTRKRGLQRDLTDDKFRWEEELH